MATYQSFFFGSTVPVTVEVSQYETHPVMEGMVWVEFHPGYHAQVYPSGEVRFVMVESEDQCRWPGMLLPGTVLPEFKTETYKNE